MNRAESPLGTRLPGPRFQDPIFLSPLAEPLPETPVCPDFVGPPC